jgi:hypothetical protein
VNIDALRTSRRLHPGDDVPTRWATADERIVPGY